MDLLKEYGIKLRNKDGVFAYLTYSIPISKKDAIVLGLRYIKKDNTYTEDLFLFQKRSKIVKYYKGRGEEVMPEYKGTHKLQRPLGR